MTNFLRKSGRRSLYFQSFTQHNFWPSLFVFNLKCISYLKLEAHTVCPKPNLSNCLGTLLYFFTEIFDDFAHGPRFHPYYFWFYVFGLNSPWLVVPPILIYQSWKELTKAQKALDNATGFNTSNGKAKIKAG